MHQELRFDGGMIGVTGDRQAAIAWYTKYLGLTLNWDAEAEQMARLVFPSGAAVTLRSLPKEQDYVREPNIRFCLTTPDLGALHADLYSQGVPTSDVEIGPDGREFFDFLDLEGTRLTAVAMPELGEAYPGGRVVHYAPPRIGVSDLERSVTWYEDYLGLQPLAGDLLDGPVLMSGGESDLPLMLEKVSAEAFEGGNQDSTSNFYFATPDLKTCHRAFASAGLTCSVIVGAPDALRVFHTYDPDGNRINVWSYPE